MHYDRYTVSTDENYEPDSNDQVLKNLLGIKDKEVIEEIEEQELLRTGNELPALYDVNHQFSARDICDIHELWLANLYPFAGKYRTVMMSKDGFPFAAPQFISKSMREFETKFLAQYTPCRFNTNQELAHALGVVHVEFILIHPFREGNGRVARLLANLMALQAGKGLLNYAPIDRTVNQQGYNNYIAAIHQGVKCKYDLIQQVFLELLKVT